MISYEDARRLMRAASDNLLNDSERQTLDEHLQSCENCRAQAAELQALNLRLNGVLKTRLESKHEPSANILARVQAQNRRNIAMNRIQFGFSTLAGVTALILVAFAFIYAFPQFTNPAAKSGTATPQFTGPATENDTATPASVTPENCDNILCEPKIESRPVVFVDEGPNGDMEIFVLRGPGQAAINISNSPGYDGKPVWSPDGRFIAFESDRNGNRDIFTVNPNGSGLRQITDSPFNQAINPQAEYYSLYGLGRSTGLFNPADVWSPDGKSILIHSESDGVWQVEVIDVESGSATLILEQAVSMAVWSPNGNQLAFITSGNINNQPPVEVINRDGTNRRVLSAGKSTNGDLTWQNAGILSWSSDGQFVFLDHNDLSGNWGIAKIAADGQEKPEPVVRGYFLDGGFPAAAWTDPEDNLYYITRYQSSMTYSFWQKGLDDKSPLITNWNIHDMCGLAGSSRQWPVYERWGIAHNGKQAILALSCPDKEISELHQLDLISGETRKIAGYDTLWENISFTWSSDDQFALAQVQNAESKEVELIQIQADTLETTLLWSGEWSEKNVPRLQPDPYWPEKPQTQTFTPDIEATALAPLWAGEKNGNLIAFLSARNGAYDIFLLKSDGSGSPVNLSNSPELEYDLAWSPDGQWLAFTRSLTGGAPWDFFIMRPDGSELTQLENGKDWFNLSWSPDSQKIGILVASRPDEQINFQIKIINTDGETILQNMALSSQPNLGIENLGWSSDGKWLYYIENENDPDTYETMRSTLYKIELENPTPVPVVQSEVPLDGWMETNGDLHYLQRTPLGWDLMQFNDGTASRKATWKFDPQQCDIGPYNWQRSATDANLAWSPDRQQVLISMPCEEGTWLYLGNLNGQLSPVLNYPLYSYTQLIQAWSPDGKSIVLDADLETPGAQHLYLLDLAVALTDPSTRPVRITQSGFDEHSPAWQPKP